MSFFRKLFLQTIIIFLATTIFSLPRSRPLEIKEIEESNTEKTNSNEDDDKKKDKDEKTIFDIEFGDENKVVFNLSGYWQSLLTGSGSYQFGFDSTPTFETDFTFTQNIDLSLNVLLNNHWFFDAQFADGFEKNTVAVGYIGENYLKEFRIANRGIKFPSIYSVYDIGKGIGGGENEALGISANFSGEKWNADFAFRYDLVETEEKRWNGYNTVTTNEIKLSDWSSGKMFALPSSEITENIAEVFVENSNGKYKDSRGLKYKKLDSSQYLLLSTRKTLLLSQDAKASKTNDRFPAVAIKLNKTTNYSKKIDDFLLETQDFFEDIDLSKYSFAKTTDSSGYFGLIDDEEVLFIQYPNGFSPFWICNVYDCGTNKTNEAVIASKTTEIVSQDFEVSINKDDEAFYQENFFDEKHIFAKIFQKTDDEENRFPFAKTNAGVYLMFPDEANKNNDFVLRIRNYSAVTSFNIGTNAIPGTVQVYKNNILDTNATYDSETGDISLSTTISTGDNIYVTWLKESEDSDNGTLAFGAGFLYKFNEYFKVDTSLSTRWAFSKDKKFEESKKDSEDFNSSGFVTAALGLDLDTTHFDFKNTIAISLESENTTGIKRLLGMDDSKNETTYLEKDDGYDVSSNIIPKIEGLNLEEKNNGSVKAKNGQRDSSISGYAIPISFDFIDFMNDDFDEEETFWATQSIKLSSATKLSSCSSFEIAIKTPNYENDFDIYLQLGVSAKDSKYEITNSYPTWKLDRKQNADWQIFKLSLTNEDRSKIFFSGNNDARIIITSNKKITDTIFVGPYEICGESFSINADKNTFIKANQEYDSTLHSNKINKLNTSTNYVQRFDWKFDSDLIEDYSISATKYFEETNIENYKTANFFFKIEKENKTEINKAINNEENEGFSFELSDSQGNIAIKTIIDSKTTFDLKEEYHLFSIELDSGKTKIDGTEVSTKTIVNKKTLPTRATFRILPVISQNESLSYFESGSLFVDEVFLDGNEPYFTLQDKAKGEIKFDGEILKNVLKDFLLKGESSINTTLNENSDLGFTLNGNFKITLLGIKFDFEGKTTQKEISSVSEKIETEKPLFKFLNLKENFVFEKNNNYSKFDEAKITTKFIDLSANTKSQIDKWLLKQNINANLETKFSMVNFSTKVKLDSKENPKTSDYEKIIESYKDSSLKQFSFNTKDSSKNEIALESTLSGKFETLSMKPKIKFETNGIYKKETDLSFNDSTSLLFAFPFSIQQNDLSFTWKKTGGGKERLEEETDNYSQNANLLCNELNEKDFLFKTIPFYDVFCDKIIQSDNSYSDESVFYSSLYEMSWKRNFNAQKFDAFIPKTVSFSFERDIRNATDSSDIYQANAKIGNKAFNLFGKSGLYPKFKWYEQDELVSSISFTAKTPRKKPSLSFLLNGYIQTSFFLNEKDLFKVDLDGSVETKHDWKIKANLFYKRICIPKIVTSAIEYFWKDKETGETSEKAKKITHTRTDNFKISLSSTSPSSSNRNDIKKYDVEYTHSLDSKVNKYLTINSSIGLGYKANWNEWVKLTAQATIGCTVNF